MSVLIVEDDLDMCLMLTFILKSKNIPSSFVNSISEAKKVFVKSYPELVLLDNQLPDGKGINFISYARNNYPETKIVMITGKSNEKVKQVALEKGASFFVAKPFKTEELSEIIDEVFSI